jgi:tetratricopeptide (TPR) repeat protein
MFLGTRAAKRRNKRNTLANWRSLLPVLVVVAGFVAYHNSLSGAFVFDNQFHIVENPRIRHLWPIWDVVSGVRRPVVNLSLAVNYALGGLNVWGYHAFNLAVHILAGLTLFRVVRRTLLREGLRDRYGSSAPWLALVVALIWVVHPLQTQSVTYVIQRSESLMGLFYLLTLYCVIRGADSPHGKAWYTGAIAACALGMGSKAVMVTAPVVMLIYDRVFIAKSFGEVFRRRWGLYAGLAATWSILITCGVVRGVLDPTPKVAANVGFAFKGITPAEYALTQPGVILHYLRLSVWPHSLCLDYNWPVARTMAAIAVPGVAIVALSAVTIWLLVRRPQLGFPGAWFFLILLPTSSFIPIKDPLFEHRMYLPLAAVIALLVVGGYAGLAYLARRLGLVGPATNWINAGLVSVIVVLLGFATIRRNEVYESDLSIWRDVTTKRPDNARAHYNLGNALAKHGPTDPAVSAYRQAVRLDPRHSKACFNLAQTLHERDELGEAVRYYRAALQTEPDFALARLSLARVLFVQGEFDQAADELRTVVKSLPVERHPELAVRAYSNLGNALERMDKLGEAADAYRAALRIQPGYHNPHYGLGLVLLKQGKIDEAILDLREALRINPGYAKARRALEAALARKARSTEE